MYLSHEVTWTDQFYIKHRVSLELNERVNKYLKMYFSHYPPPSVFPHEAQFPESLLLAHPRVNSPFLDWPHLLHPPPLRPPHPVCGAEPEALLCSWRDWYSSELCISPAHLALSKGLEILTCKYVCANWEALVKSFSYSSRLEELFAVCDNVN